MKSFLVSLLLLCFCYTHAQYDRGNQNYLGITAGYAQVDLLTDVDIQSNGGFYLGIETRGALYNDWDMVYGLDLFQNTYEAQGQFSPSSTVENIDYTLLGGQVKLLASYRIINPNLSVDFGPALHFNGSLDLDNDDFEDYFLTSADNTAEELQQAANIGLNAVIGVTGGFEKFRLRVQYHFGVLNFWNAEDINGDKIKGNLGILYIGAVYYF